MVSPAEKDGSGIEPLRREGGLIQASEDGDAITYVANGPIVPEPEGNRAPYPTQAIAHARRLRLVIAADRDAPHEGRGLHPRRSARVPVLLVRSLQALVQPDNQSPNEPLEQPPLSPEASEKTMYLRDSATGLYVPVVTAANDTAGTHFGGKLEFVDATPDLSHVVLSSEVAADRGRGPRACMSGSRGSRLQPVSVLPDGSPALEPSVGR